MEIFICPHIVVAGQVMPVSGRHIRDQRTGRHDGPLVGKPTSLECLMVSVLNMWTCVFSPWFTARIVRWYGQTGAHSSQLYQYECEERSEH